MPSGVLKEKPFFGLNPRFFFQRIFPVRRFSDATNWTSEPSQLTTSESPTSAGEPPLPCVGLYRSFVFRQITLPFRSRQAVPLVPK